MTYLGENGILDIPDLVFVEIMGYLPRTQLFNLGKAIGRVDCAESVSRIRQFCKYIFIRNIEL